MRFINKSVEGYNMKRLSTLLGMVALTGCSLQEKAIKETSIYRSDRSPASIYAVDYDGVSRVILSDSKGNVLFDDPLNNIYLNKPTKVHVDITNRTEDGVYFNKSLENGLQDGNYTITVHDRKGNLFNKKVLSASQQNETPR